MPMYFQQIVSYSLACAASGYEAQISKTIFYWLAGAVFLQFWLSIVLPKGHPGVVRVDPAWQVSPARTGRGLPSSSRRFPSSRSNVGRFRSSVRTSLGESRDAGGAIASGLASYEASRIDLPFFLGEKPSTCRLSRLSLAAREFREHTAMAPPI